MENELSLRNEWCFGCGHQNPFGLKLTFEEQDETYIARFTGRPQHQGYDGIMHGGIVSTLLDEIMARYLYAKGMNAVTARLEVRYLKPTPIGVPLLLKGRIVERLVSHAPGTDKNQAEMNDIPFFNRQVKIVLRNSGIIDPLKIDEKIKAMDSAIDEFIKNVDFALNESNVRTEIEVDLVA